MGSSAVRSLVAIVAVSAALSGAACTALLGDVRVADDAGVSAGDATAAEDAGPGAADAGPGDAGGAGDARAGDGAPPGDATAGVDASGPPSVTHVACGDAGVPPGSIALWLQAAPIAQPAPADVATWASCASSANSAWAPSSPTPRVYPAGTGGAAHVTFGAAQHLALTSPIPCASCSVFVVASLVKTTPVGVFLSGGIAPGGANQSSLFGTLDGSQVDLLGGGGTSGQLTATTAVDFPHVWEAQNATGISDVLLDGTSLQSSGANPAAVPDIVFSDIGAFAGSSGPVYSSMDVYELLVYSPALADADRSAVRSYLRAKYGTP